MSKVKYTSARPRAGALVSRKAARRANGYKVHVIRMHAGGFGKPAKRAAGSGSAHGGRRS